MPVWRKGSRYKTSRLIQANLKRGCQFGPPLIRTVKCLIVGCDSGGGMLVAHHWDRPTEMDCRHRWWAGYKCSLAPRGL